MTIFFSSSNTFRGKIRNFRSYNKNFKFLMFQINLLSFYQLEVYTVYFIFFYKQYTVPTQIHTLSNMNNKNYLNVKRANLDV